ncbi:MAG TPA: UDP-N-acetylmuramoyl-L-alanine--D-glutamate ligase, partial [Marinilabiliaceae bacterium]|nr:UDP-N-acetylmuramoyl-L-alanine--D-glutamate ligase [Marinilabiliaceae bacterium]
MQTRIVILGAGESGVGAALLAKSKGYDVFVSDYSKIAESFKNELIAHQIEYEEEGHSEEKIFQAEEVIKSPGIPDTASIIRSLQKKGISVIGDIEFAGRYSNAYMVGITGSNGKTTCVLWLDYILKLAGVDFVLAGNVGVSPCRTLVERDPACFVMELSSFQLDSMNSFRCNIAVVTNITPDHLDRYDHDIKNYIQSKLRIVQNQTAEDLFVFSADDPIIADHLKEVKTPARRLPFSLGGEDSARIENEELVLEIKELLFKMALDEVALKGKHNLYNAMAVGLCALNMGVTPEILRNGLSTFKGVEHRLEYVEEIKGVVYINDS